ncbi:MAG: arginine repressor [Lachnospiraceae bacterium]|nr:arginine repressor [Lachnospiraceae bacterium]
MKKKRQDLILEIINSREIETQEELAYALKSAGCSVTQATVSRDIRELGLTKKTGKSGKQIYVRDVRTDPALSEKYIRVLRAGFVRVEQAMNILVIRTVSGTAMAVAAALDDMNLPEVAGCIAGDDTVMAVIKTVEDAAAVREKILDMIR